MEVDGRGMVAPEAGRAPSLAVIARYRRHEAAAPARLPVAEPGHSDPAHPTRDFSATVGMPPDRYAGTGGLGR